MIIILELIWVFFKIGLFTIGGGYAMIPMIEDEVITRGWLTKTELVDFLAVSESTPGPFAINMATFVGYNQLGVLGSILATISVALPSFIIIIIIAKFISKFSDSKIVKAVMSGIKPVVVGLIAAVVIDLLKNNIFPKSFNLNNIEYKSLIIIGLVFGLSRIYKKMHPILLILISASLGLVLYGLL